MGSSWGRPAESWVRGCQPSRKAGEYGGTATLSCELTKGRAGFFSDQQEAISANASTLQHTDQGKVQLGPSDFHSSFSPLVKCSWSSEMAPVVIAGLTTDAPNAGPPVVFTICERQTPQSVSQARGGWIEKQQPKGPTRSRGTKTGCRSCGASGCVM